MALLEASFLVVTELTSSIGAPIDGLSAILVVEVGRRLEDVPHVVEGSEVGLEGVHRSLQREQQLGNVALHVLALLRHGLHQAGQDVGHHAPGHGHADEPEHLQLIVAVMCRGYTKSCVKSFVEHRVCRSLGHSRGRMFRAF